jgi:predicted metal-dependent phosphoesterase TrpH
VECFNARTLPGDNRKAREIAEKFDLAKTAGSDSHFFFEIGTAYTIFDNNLRSAIKKKDTKIEGSIKFGAIGGALSYIRKRIL